MSVEMTYGIPMILFSIVAVSATFSFAVQFYSTSWLGRAGSVAAVCLMTAGTAVYDYELLSDTGDGTLGVVLAGLSVAVMVAVAVVVAVMSIFRTDEPGDASPPETPCAPLATSAFPAGYRRRVRVAGRHHPGRRQQS